MGDSSFAVISIPREELSRILRDSLAKLSSVCLVGTHRRKIVKLESPRKVVGNENV